MMEDDPYTKALREYFRIRDQAQRLTLWAYCALMAFLLFIGVMIVR